MGSKINWIALLVIAQCSAVLCRNNFYEYYYSRFHHKRSSTEALLSSTADNSTEVTTRPLTAVDILLGNVLHGTTGNTKLQNVSYSEKGDQGMGVDTNVPNIMYGDYYYRQRQQDLQVTIVCVFGGVFGFILIVSLCLFCILRSCRRGNEIRRGFILSNPQTTLQGQPQQPVASQQYQQPLVTQPYPAQRQETGDKGQAQPVQHPPPVQQQYQYSLVTPQSHNQPEAPPAYEFPEKF